MRKSSVHTRHYPPNTSRNAEILVTFRQQMADYARGQQLRALRNERHLSQEDAAHQIGVSTKALRTWEKGGKIKWPNAKAAGAFYGVDPESLVTREPGDLSLKLATDAPDDQLARIEAMLGSIDERLETLEAHLSSLGEDATVPQMPSPPPAPRLRSASDAPPKRRRKTS